MHYCEPCDWGMCASCFQTDGADRLLDAAWTACYAGGPRAPAHFEDDLRAELERRLAAFYGRARVWRPLAALVTTPFWSAALFGYSARRLRRARRCAARRRGAARRRHGRPVDWQR